MVKANREGVLFTLFCGGEQIRTRLTIYPKGESKSGSPKTKVVPKRRRNNERR